MRHRAVTSHAMFAAHLKARRDAVSGTTRSATSLVDRPSAEEEEEEEEEEELWLRIPPPVIESQKEVVQH